MEVIPAEIHPESSGADFSLPGSTHGSDRILRLYGNVSYETVPPLVERLLSLDAASAEPIHFYLWSSGGCVISGLALIDVIQHIQAPVWVYGIGLIASMAAVILAAGAPGHRYILPHARLLLHATSGSAAGRLADLNSSIRLQRSLSREVEDLLVTCTQMKRPQVRRFLQADRYLSVTEAKKFGLVDQVICTDAAATTKNLLQAVL